MIFINNMPELSVEGLLSTFNENMYFWCIIFSLISISLLFVWDFICRLKKTKSMNKKPIDLKTRRLLNNESEVLNYFVMYLIPILTLNPAEWTSITSNFLLVFIVGLHFVKNNLLGFNILLLIFNYNIYKDQYSNIYITKRKLNDIHMNDLMAYQYKQYKIFFIPN